MNCNRVLQTERKSNVAQGWGNTGKCHERERVPQSGTASITVEYDVAGQRFRLSFVHV